MAKSRLALALPNEARLALVAALLDQTLVAARPVGRIYLVSPDPVAGTRWVPDSGGGLNPAVLAGLRAATTDGAKAAIVLPADLPLISTEAIRRIADALADCRPGGIVIAPDRRRLGTNALGVVLPTSFEPRFGTASFPAHLAAASSVRIIDDPALAFDLDEPDDLDLRKLPATISRAIFAGLTPTDHKR